MAVKTYDLTALRRKHAERLIATLSDENVLSIIDPRNLTQLSYARSLIVDGMGQLEQKQAQGLTPIESRRYELRIAVEVMIMLGVDPEPTIVGASHG